MLATLYCVSYGGTKTLPFGFRGTLERVLRIVEGNPNLLPVDFAGLLSGRVGMTAAPVGNSSPT